VHKVVITDPASAPALVGTGVAVLVAGPDAVAVGSAVAALRAAGADAAGWVGDPSDEGVREMAAELFPGHEVVPAGDG
jgi:TRAP-type mannitol/chloroaromatic compound transport system substrate-binding protein